MVGCAVARRCVGRRQRRADCAAVLGFRSRRITRFTRCARCARTDCGESAHEAREYARRPKPCAPRRRTGAPPHTAHGFARQHLFFVGGRSQAGHRARLSPRRAPAARGNSRARCPRVATHPPPRTIVPARLGAGRRWGCVCDGEERSPGVGARTRALRRLTRRNCPSATSAASEASFAARPQREYRSAPRAAGRRIRTPAPAGPMPCLRTLAAAAYLQTLANRLQGPPADADLRAHSCVVAARERVIVANPQSRSRRRPPGHACRCGSAACRARCRARVRRG